MLIALDYETNGLHWWRDDFKVLSASFAWPNRDGDIAAKYVEGEAQVKDYIGRALARCCQFVVHNAAFEWGVSKYHLGIDLPIAIDTMRLGQQWGNVREKGEGYGLSELVKRVLPHLGDHKAMMREWVLQNCDVKAGRWGRHIGDAPRDLLEAYNNADARITYMLYAELNKRFRRERFDWQPDHLNYLMMVRNIVAAQAEGIKVDRAALEAYIPDIDAEIAKFQQDFYELNADGIQQVREMLRAKAQAKLKKKILTECPPFNPNSNDQLAMLFVDVYGIKPVLRTETNKPSFKSDHLGQWGPRIEPLRTMGKRMIVRNQAKTLLEKSEYDGKWHHELKVCGTVTFRFAGGGDLNVQGLARRDERLMTALKPPNDDEVFVSIDLAAGEPSITCEYTKDANYRYYIFDSVGKAPFYDAQGLLKIDDIYLATAAIGPEGEEAVLAAWKALDWPEGDFVSQWLKDSEVVKKRLKKVRQFYKMVVLAMTYGAQAKTIHAKMAEAGMRVDLQVVEAFCARYWLMFPAIKKMVDDLAEHVKRHRVLVNPFGMRLTPSPRNAYNALIQSSVNGVMDLFTKYVSEEAESGGVYARFLVRIHDEDIWRVKKADLERFRKVCQAATDRLNATLGWSIQIRTGFAPGANLYEAK